MFRKMMFQKGMFWHVLAIFLKMNNDWIGTKLYQDNINLIG